MNTIKSMSNALPSLPSFSIGPASPNPDERTFSPPVSPPLLHLLTTHREALQAFKAIFNHHAHYLGKKKTNPCGIGTKTGAHARRADSSLSWIGEEFKDAGERLEGQEEEDLESKRLASILYETGSTHIAVAKQNEEYLDSLNVNTLTPLDYRLDTYKQFFSLHSAAVKAHSALESLVQKVEKNKDGKGSEELELELETVERNYQDKVDEISRSAKSLVDGFKEETKWVRSFVEDEIEHLNSSLSALTSLQSSISPSSTTSTTSIRFPSPSTAPTLPSRTTSLKPPSTRMSRSKSEVSTPTFSTQEKDRTSFLRRAVGGRGSAGDLNLSGERDDSESSSPSKKGGKDKDKEKDDGKRSRSASLSVKDAEDGKRSRSGSGAGSMLSRVGVPSFGLRKKSHSVGEKEKGKHRNGEEEDEDEGSRPAEEEDDDDGSIHGGGGGGFNYFIPSLPTLPTLNSIKKLGGNDTSDYNSLTDDILIPRTPPPTAPILKRTQTAPPTTPTKSPSQALPLSRTSSPPNSITPINKIFIASWSYPPTNQEPDQEELTFSKNDLIKVTSTVNEEWWVGTVTKGNTEGMVGLFPKGFVKEYIGGGEGPGPGSERKKAPPPPPPGRKRGTSRGAVQELESGRVEHIKEESDPFGDF